MHIQFKDRNLKSFLSTVADFLSHSIISALFGQDIWYKVMSLHARSGLRIQTLCCQSTAKCWQPWTSWCPVQNEAYLLQHSFSHSELCKSRPTASHLTWPPPSGLSPRESRSQLPGGTFTSAAFWCSLWQMWPGGSPGYIPKFSLLCLFAVRSAHCLTKLPQCSILDFSSTP